jgi:hypothetical protein
MLFVISPLTFLTRNHTFDSDCQCEISSNNGVGITRIDGSDLKLTNCTLKQNGTDRVQRIKEEKPPHVTLSSDGTCQHHAITDT